MRPSGPPGSPQPARASGRRRAMHARSRRGTAGSHRRGVAGAGVAALAALAVVAGAAALPVATTRAQGRHPVRQARRPIATPTHHASSSAAGPVCPLTGAPAPDGTVPARPALAVKVDNYPTARPQSALDQADIVFDEPVEGFITRLVAVFQCTSPTLIGPVRSARQPDVPISDLLSHPLLVHAGGTNYILAMLNAANLDNIDIVFRYSNLPVHPPGRYAPYDTYVAAQTMWNLAPSDTTPPAPVFSYDSALPTGGVPTTSIHIPYSGTNDVRWTWDATTGQWQQSYGNRPATTLSGSAIDGTPARVTATNIVAIHVKTYLGPYTENSLGAHDVYVTAIGSGPAVVLRNGVAITGTWHRTSLSSPMQLVDKHGATIPLAPGRTWVEMVPSSIPITTTPAGSAGGSSPGSAVASTQTAG